MTPTMPTPQQPVMTAIAARILWPAFVAAGVLEMAVFALVDPASLHGFNGAPIAWSAQAIYTAAFGLFWAVVSMATAMTFVLLRAPAELNEAGTRSNSESSGGEWTQR